MMSTKKSKAASPAEATDSTVARRLDTETARIVDKGLLFQERVGTDYAATYLKEVGISIDVALRVLSKPSARRK